MHILGVNCKCVCPLCNGPRGVSRKQTVDRIVHFGHRCFLPEDHFIRYHGMSKDCCPVGYYEGTDESVESVNKLFEDFKVTSRPKVIPKPVPTSRWTPLVPRTKATFGVPAVAAIQPYAKACDGNQSRVAPNMAMFNKGYEAKHFQDFIQPAHCDFRKQRIYERHLDDHYDDNGVGYEQEYEQLEFEFSGDQDMTSLGRLKLKKKVQKLLKDKFNGVKGLSPYYALIYKRNRAGIRDSVCFDPFHCIMNIASKIILLMKGEKFKVDKHLKLALCENRFPFIGLKSFEVEVDVGVKKKKKKSVKKTKRNQYSDISNSNLIPFTLSKKQQEMVDWRQNCIVLPYGHKTSNSFRFIFRQTGYLKGNDKINKMVDWLSQIYIDVFRFGGTV